MLLNFFMRTTILLNQLRCTAICLPFKQVKKQGADEADLKARLHCQEDPTPTTTSLRSVTSALATGSMEVKFETLSSNKFKVERTGQILAGHPHLHRTLPCVYARRPIPPVFKIKSDT